MSEYEAPTTTRRAKAPVGAVPLWFGILGGAAAWATQLALGDFIAEVGCEHGSPGWIEPALLVLSGLATAVGAWALVVAWRAHVVSRERAEVSVADERAAFMALAGVLSSSLFLLLLVLGGFLPHVFLETCGS